MSILDHQPLSTVERPRRPVVELLGLAVPTIAQMASYTVMQFLDTWMLAKASGGAVDPPTAVGNAGLLAFTLICFGMGTLWVVNTLVSQSFGRKTYEECGRYLWQGAWFGCAYGGTLLALLPLLGPVFRWMGHDPALAMMEDRYLRLVLTFSTFKLVGTAFSQFLLAIDRPAKVFTATFIGVGTNAVAAWILVLGGLGISKHGVAGAAWAQNIGGFVEFGCLVYFATRPAIRGKFHVPDARLRWPEMRTLLKVGAPSGLQTTGDVFAWMLFSMWIIARFGASAMAANTFMFRYMSVSFMPAVGVSVAVTALVGRYIGRGEPDTAARRANLGFRLIATYMLLCGTAFFVWRRQAIGLFTNEPAVLRAGATLMVFAAVYQFFDAMYIGYNGALRGAGDTFVPGLVTAGLCWGVTVLGGYLVARLRPQYGVAGPWTVATAYGIMLGAFMYGRFARGRWRSIRLEHREPSKSGGESDTIASSHLLTE